MTFEQFQKRFHPSLKAHPEFVTQLKIIDERLDCVFNVLEQCWMIILWQNPIEWNWVMTLRDHETGARYLPCDFVIDRLRELKHKWLSKEMEKEIEASEAKVKKENDAYVDDMFTELAKDLRRPLINDMDGVVSSFNVFL